MCLCVETKLSENGEKNKRKHTHARIRDKWRVIMNMIENKQTEYWLRFRLDANGHIERERKRERRTRLSYSFIVLNKMIFTWDMCAISPFVNWIFGCPKNVCLEFARLLLCLLCLWVLILPIFFSFFYVAFDNAYALWKSLQLMRVDLSLYPFICIHCDAMPSIYCM